MWDKAWGPKLTWQMLQGIQVTSTLSAHCKELSYFVLMAWKRPEVAQEPRYFYPAGRFNDIIFFFLGTNSSLYLLDRRILVKSLALREFNPLQI
jgi:hypothetical protein